ncbi:MAG TPA: DUF892 family protein [Mucilaginibacter sp.]
MRTTTANIKRDGLLESPWQQAGDAVLSGMLTDQVYDCLIVGAGITGLTAGLILQQTGKHVVIADLGTVGFGTTGGTSAHINNFADTTYTEAESAFGEEGAKLFADAIQEGASLIKTNIDRFGIDCDYESKTGYLYAETDEEAKQLDNIYQGMLKVGIPATYKQEAPTPVPVKKVLEIAGQAQFHPIKYLRAIKDAFLKAGGILLENTLIDKLENEGDVHFVQLGDKRVSARKVIYATHMPPGINVFSFRCAPYRSYVLAVKLKDNDYPDAVIYDLQEPYHYMRTHVINGEPLLLVGGNDHKTGHDDPERAFAGLEEYTRKYYNVSSVKYHWSSQYYIPADGFPYIGQIPFMPDGILTATGFNGNGMMLGSISAKILADQVMGVENRYNDIFSTRRIKPVDGFTEFVKENADVAYHFVADRFGIPETDSLKRLTPGTGKVLEFDGKKLAVYRNDQGGIQALSPVCTHAGCIVNFNNAEKTWDCPCHGGRYHTDGSVITGPPTHALQQIQINLQTNQIMPTTKDKAAAQAAPNRSPEAGSALRELFIDELKDIYWAEQHLVKSLPKMIKGATSDDLKNTIQQHLIETEGHVSRLEQIFDSIGEKAKAVKCEAMEGLLKEAEELLKETDKGTEVRDVAIISAAQKVEHYEIASYGTMRTLAGTLGLNEAQDLLQQTLDEEKNADKLLSEAADTINEQAAAEVE